MHVEIKIALNFVISFLYNKLPRRRVNIFGEELDNALREKFQGHWYPDKPFKGSAFRCLKVSDTSDPVMNKAAMESCYSVQDIIENLPQDLAIWIDPGEVSYRIGEKGAVKILYSESDGSCISHPEDTVVDKEVSKTFNPEAQCFRPIEILGNSMNGLSVSPKVQQQPQTAPPPPPSQQQQQQPTTVVANTFSPPPPQPPPPFNSTGVYHSFFAPPRPQPSSNLITAGQFAQTKFGSTKLKSNGGKKVTRMSPTEFSSYIKNRALQQHHQHQQQTRSSYYSLLQDGQTNFSLPPPSSRAVTPPPLLSGISHHDSYFSNGFGQQQQKSLGQSSCYGEGGVRNAYDSSLQQNGQGGEFIPNGHLTGSKSLGGNYGMYEQSAAFNGKSAQITANSCWNEGSCHSSDGHGSQSGESSAGSTKDDMLDGIVGNSAINGVDGIIGGSNLSGSVDGLVKTNSSAHRVNYGLNGSQRVQLVAN